MKPILEFPCLPNPVCTTIVVTSKPRRKAQDNLLPFKFLEKKKNETDWQTHLFFLCRHQHYNTMSKQPKYSQKYIRNLLGFYLVQRRIRSKNQLCIQPMMTEPKPEFGLRSKNPEKTLTKGLKIREIRLGRLL